MTTDVQVLSDFERETEEFPSLPLKEIAPSPWRSLGRVLDYQNWPERDRFVELDFAIRRLNALRDQYERQRQRAAASRPS